LDRTYEAELSALQQKQGAAALGGGHAQRRFSRSLIRCLDHVRQGQHVRTKKRDFLPEAVKTLDNAPKDGVVDGVEKNLLDRFALLGAEHREK
jgi:hypothetical protein